MPLPHGEEVSFLRKWVVAVRPWSFPASSMPVVFGTSLAWVIGRAPVHVLRALLALLAMVVLHAAANMLSDVFDYKRGLDREATPVSGAVVRRWISTRQAARTSTVLFVLGAAIGLVLVAQVGRVLLYIGLVGLPIGAGYTLLKYRALGDLAVGLNFGLLGSLGAWVVQTESFSWLPVVWSVPQAVLIVAILHANNWRDTVSDRERRVTTMASLFGDRGSLVYYGALLLVPFVYIFALVFLPPALGPEVTAMPLTFLVILLALPKALGLWARARRRHAPRHPLDFVVLDGATAQYNLVFGCLCISALWIQFVLTRL
jgi:1,4-dihydroxy-2-naphthoate octaprenyltransferase